MGRTYVRTFGECDKHGLVIEITCTRCQRVAYASAYQMIGITTRSGFKILASTLIETIGPLLRCRGGKGAIGCQAKGARIAPLWPHELKVPAGVPVLPFLNADERERNRLIRIARG